MGWEHIVIYDGGWYEWSADPTNPVDTGDPTSAAVTPPAPPPAPSRWNSPVVYALAAVAGLAVAVLFWPRRKKPTPPPPPTGPTP